MASNFQLLPTPHEEEFMFSVRVPQDYIGPGLVFPDGSTLISAQSAALVGRKPTSFKQCGWTVGREMLSKFPAYGDYVYLKSGKPDADHVTLFFGRPKTSLERSRPFNVYYATRQYTWPAVLEDQFVSKVVDFPQTVNTSTGVKQTDRLLPRYRYRPPVPYNSVVRIEQYLADVAWKESDLIHDQPIPTDIDAFYVGLSINFQRCLHPRLEFPNTDSSEQPIYGIGVVPTPIGRSFTKQVFPATNFTDWAPFVIQDDQVPTDGLWLREKITIFPPPTPDETIQ